MTTNNMKSKKEEYNPIQGDILSFLNEVTKIHKEQQQGGSGNGTEAVDRASEASASSVPAKAAPKNKGLNMNSVEAFPALGEGIPVAAPGTDDGSSGTGYSLGHSLGQRRVSSCGRASAADHFADV